MPWWCTLGIRGHRPPVPGQFHQVCEQLFVDEWLSALLIFSDLGESHHPKLVLPSALSKFLVGSLPASGGPDIAHLAPWCWWKQSHLIDHFDQLPYGWGPETSLLPPAPSAASSSLLVFWWGGWDPPHLAHPRCHLHSHHLPSTEFASLFVPNCCWWVM